MSWEEEIIEYTREIERNPNGNWTYAARGSAYLYLKKYEQAIQDFSKAIEIDPYDTYFESEFERPYNGRGLAYLKLNQYESAIQDFNRCIKLNREGIDGFDDEETYNNLGLAYLGLKQYEKAIKNFNEAIEIDSDFEEAYNNAIIAGEILSDIIGSQKFFGAKINLVGHSLGCRVIYYCLRNFSENYKTQTETINDVIFLAGATTIDKYNLRYIVDKFVGGRFIHCFNKYDSALFVSQPFSDSPIGLNEIWNYDSKIENYETDLEHTDYCCNLDKILEKIEEKRDKGQKKISFI